jgi:signal transduction histidine kinase
MDPMANEIFAVACAVVCSMVILPGFRSSLPGWIRRRALPLLLLVLALSTFGLDEGQYRVPSVIVLAAGLLVWLAPAIAARVVPYALFALAAYGIGLINGFFVRDVPFYGLVPGPYVETWTTNGWLGVPTWTHYLVLPEAMVFLAAGLWLLVRTEAPGSGLVRGFIAALRGRGPVPGELVVPVLLLWIGLAGQRHWSGYGLHYNSQKVIAFVLAMAAVLVLLHLSRRIAALVAVGGLTVFSGYGILVARVGPSVPAGMYGVMFVDDGHRAVLAGAQGLVLLLVAARLWPALGTTPDAAILAEQSRRLSQRVQRLTQTRSDAADVAIAELKRIERDLHDGAQARLVALGMSLRTAEQLMSTSPEAARALVAEARQTSVRALDELRDLVRGIDPPVLADRGLVDALRSLALDSPLPVDVDVSFDGGIDMPLAAAVYFAVAEALANAVRHSGADRVHISLERREGVLRAEVTDDGCGGASPSLGTGLAGVERRLATFDGILAVSSPAGGPTIVVIEVPCALSSAKTSIS